MIKTNFLLILTLVVVLMGSLAITDKAAEASTRYSHEDLMLLARLIHGEARGESYKGQVAVGAVVLNRVESSSYPNSLKGVIYQRNQFDAVRDGQINMRPNATAIAAARDALNGSDPTRGAMFYYNPYTSTSKWIFTRPVVTQIGNHAFAV